MAEQVLDVKGSVRLLRRHWRTVAVFALVGAVAGAGYEALRPAGYHATSLVLLPASQSGSSSATSSSTAPTKNDITTDGRIATSAAVLVPAGRTVDRSATLAELQRRVATSAAATGVLQITASGPTARQAEALANAVSQQLVAFVTTNGSSVDAEELSALQAEGTQIEQQLADVQAEIGAADQRMAADGAASAAGQRDAELVGQLTSEQSTLTLQLDTVKSQIAQAKLGQLSANQGTRVIQQAATAAGPSLPWRLLPPGAGLLAGAVVGSLVVLAVRRRDPRLWTRDELAGAVGSPVLLSLPSPARRTTGEWVALLEQSRPGAAEEWHVRRALRELDVGEGGGPHLVVLSLAGDVAALAEAVRVAVGAAGSGVGTVLSVVADDESVAGLEAACTWFGNEGRQPRPGLAVRAGVPVPRQPTPGLAVTAVVLDPARPVLPALDRPGTATVLSVSAGFASSEQLARVAIAAAHDGEPVAGVFVANPSPGDRTSGRTPAGGPVATLGTHRRSTVPGTPALGGRPR